MSGEIQNPIPNTTTKRHAATAMMMSTMFVVGLKGGEGGGGGEGGLGGDCGGRGWLGGVCGDRGCDRNRSACGGGGLGAGGGGFSMRVFATGATGHAEMW